MTKSTKPSPTIITTISTPVTTPATTTPATTTLTNNTTTTTQPQIRTPPLNTPTKIPLYQNYRLQYHIVFFLVSIGCYINILQIAFGCLRDLPDMRLIFAQIFQSQENNQAINYGRISSILISVVMYSHFYLISEFFYIKWDFQIYRNRRRLVTHFYLFMSFLTILLPCGVLYQLSHMLQWNIIISKSPFNILYLAVQRYIIVFLCSAIGLTLFPLQAPLYPSKKQSIENDNNNNNNQEDENEKDKKNKEPKLTKKQLLLTQRKNLTPLDPKDHKQAFAELAQRFPDQGNVDIFNVGHDEIIQPLSRFDHIDSDPSSSSDQDEDDDDKDDYTDSDDNNDEELGEKLDKMIAEMTQVLISAKKSKKQD